MITLPQIRAARGLLNWSQKELAVATNLSITAMNNIDRGLAEPRAATLAALRRVLEREGVEFTEAQGVRFKEEIFRTKVYDGPDAFERYARECIGAMIHSRQEGLHMVADETPFLKIPSDRKTFFHYYQQMQHNKLKERILLAEGAKGYGPPDCVEYRWCSPELARQIGTSIYGNNYCLFIGGKFIIIENLAIARAFRHQFEENWSRAIIPPARGKSQFEKDLEYVRKKT